MPDMSVLKFARPETLLSPVESISDLPRLLKKERFLLGPLGPDDWLPSLSDR